MPVTKVSKAVEYHENELEALRCIRNAVDSMDACSPLAARAHLCLAVDFVDKMVDCKQEFDMIGED